MEHVTLPSGKSILNLSRSPVKTDKSKSDDTMVSTSGAMILEQDGKCPKCIKQMGFAFSGNEQVYYCATCRVSLPLPIVE